MRKDLEKTAELRVMCQRSDCIQRRVSIYITRFFLKFNLMSPTQITILDFFVGLIGVLLLFIGSDWAFISGGIFLQLFEIFDCVDGEVARYLIQKGELKRTRAEHAVVEFIQDIVHPILQPLMFLGFSYGLYFNLHQDWILIIGYIAALGSSVDTYINIIREKLMVSADLKQASRIYKEMKESTGRMLKKMPLGNYLLEFITFITPIPGVMVALLTVSILDLVFFPGMSGVHFYGLVINFKILALVFYACIEQALWIQNAHGSIKTLQTIE